MPESPPRSTPPRAWLFATLAPAAAVIVVIGPALFDHFTLNVPIVVTQLVFSGGAWTGWSSGLVGYSGLPLGLRGYSG